MFVITHLLPLVLHVSHHLNELGVVSGGRPRACGGGGARGCSSRGQHRERAGVFSWKSKLEGQQCRQGMPALLLLLRSSGQQKTPLPNNGFPSAPHPAPRPTAHPVLAHPWTAPREPPCSFPPPPGTPPTCPACGTWSSGPGGSRRQSCRRTCRRHRQYSVGDTCQHMCRHGEGQHSRVLHNAVGACVALQPREGRATATATPSQHPRSPTGSPKPQAPPSPPPPQW